MGHVVEQRPDGQPGPEQGPASEHAPGSDIQPARQAQPAQSPPPDLDQEQLRQFQQFQQFQDFLRFQEAQRQGGAEVVPGQQPQYHPAPAATQQLIHQPPAPPRRRVPGWLRWLGKKILGWLIFFLLLALALTWAYNYFFGSDEGDSTKSAAQMGGGKYHTNEVLSTRPHVAVQKIYQLVAEGSYERACVRFDNDRGIEQKFARDLGYPDCRQAVLGLQTEVSHVTDYSRSIYPQYYDPNATTLRIDSCDFEISGGPALGIFTLTKVERDQWLITGHEPGPKVCPDPAPDAGETTSPGPSN
ncbi:hypothetical protein [Prauserella endophytica]|uniref:DUF4878 domain-containing protein n=1 Tax=Prauserella endophytica TaxID=1592324 RepID=A0ABY2S0Z9_9PSEU|nr:hypothetical protein [Prauserella endophytica]PXY17133.1 hypothetical protein BAY59_36820 [Prauserella coralliicola]TKG67572.1 hypothetical protein FCN18_22730 [Prauserella endophytica]